jgi:hypothetical protein
VGGSIVIIRTSDDASAAKRGNAVGDAHIENAALPVKRFFYKNVAFPLAAILAAGSRGLESATVCADAS